MHSLCSRVGFHVRLDDIDEPLGTTVYGIACPILRIPEVHFRSTCARLSQNAILTLPAKEYACKIQHIAEMPQPKEDHDVNVPLAFAYAIHFNLPVPKSTFFFLLSDSCQTIIFVGL